MQASSVLENRVDHIEQWKEHVDPHIEEIPSIKMIATNSVELAKRLESKFDLLQRWIIATLVTGMGGLIWHFLLGVKQ